MSQEDDELPAFSRTNKAGEPMDELRVNLPVWKLGVIDAVASSETATTGLRVSRTTLADRIITEWVNKKVDEATLIHRVVKSNPTVLES
jgi:hypothetical protein